MERVWCCRLCAATAVLPRRARVLWLESSVCGSVAGLPLLPQTQRTSSVVWWVCLKVSHSGDREHLARPTRLGQGREHVQHPFIAQCHNVCSRHKLIYTK